MSVINILSPQLADMIAAGEVVERPASVIKELMENSIDAGASSITVEIKNGGSTFIRVIDNGCGMSPDDAGLAFTRHATSKLSSAKGLESISTMGFRGEALAAISSVSRIVLTTCLRGSSEGCLVELEGGEIADMKLAGCPEGTTITVSNLFYNTPARLKFLKSDRAEAQACVAAGMRCALGRPDIQVRFIKDGVEEFFSPGDGDISSCIYNVLGRDYYNSLLECSGTSDGTEASSVCEVLTSRNRTLETETVAEPMLALETTVQTAVGMNPDKLHVAVNGLPLTEDYYHYNGQTGALQVAMSSAAVASVDVTEEKTGILEKLADAVGARTVHAVSEMLGIDPFEVANEGKVVMGVKADKAEAVLEAIKGEKYGENAAIVGEVVEGEYVIVNTPIGGERILEAPIADPVPRVC